jgi:hypothetical protein
VKGGWREGEERVRRSVNPIPNPDFADRLTKQALSDI